MSEETLQLNSTGKKYHKNNNSEVIHEWESVFNNSNLSLIIPERALWLAVVETAVKDLEKAKCQKTIDRCMEWFLDDSPELRSFRFCCDAVGLDYHYVRKLVLEIYQSKVTRISEIINGR